MSVPYEGDSTTKDQPGIKGFNSVGGDGVQGWGTLNGPGRGVVGVSGTQTGVEGFSQSGEGVHGETKGNVAAVAAFNLDPGQGQGVWAHSDHGEGVHGETNSQTFAAVAAFMTNPEGVGAALHAENHGKGVGIFAKGGRLAALFEGDVEVSGDIRLMNADCAEDFDISCAEQIDPGSVMVIDQEGALRRSDQAYDRRVAGVVSGAGDCRPGIILGRQQVHDNKVPVALVGKVYCKVDAGYSPVVVGDLLTTSPTPGCAMKAEDHVKAFGAVIGKALRSLKAGQGIIPILIALQ